MTADDVHTIAEAARVLVKAHKRRAKGYKGETLAEHVALSLLAKAMADARAGERARRALP